MLMGNVGAKTIATQAIEIGTVKRAGCHRDGKRCPHPGIRNLLCDDEGVDRLRGGSSGKDVRKSFEQTRWELDRNPRKIGVCRRFRLVHFPADGCVTSVDPFFGNKP